ncbi:hypothetical protein BESB_052510 [Besnoitia besnoiti]|uniref:Fusaric acid resistance-like protein n=1 Tax=Besnoitia besnoiti TaxID=94643 RepID=A0A2A9MJM3_BESBE|nr:hypothetical protein BESB_052510 [Besnoitia besnoiti]PFH35600.1 hypothetical protein BESB_052510 [Besnoitia besnoiti]
MELKRNPWLRWAWPNSGRKPSPCAPSGTGVAKDSSTGDSRGRLKEVEQYEQSSPGRQRWDVEAAGVISCFRRCAANLQKTWWPRLNRGVRIGAITTLSLHLSVCKTLPLIGGMPGQGWCINTYSLASTSLPEQSGAVFSCFWVWVFTLACIAIMTFILFPVLTFGASLGRSMCLLLFLLIISWLSIIRLPMTYRVAPFVTHVNTHSMTGFAYVYLPYTTAAVILAQQYRAFDTDLHTGLKFIASYNAGVLAASLLGWALFTLQVALPPWSSQRHNVRVALSGIMLDVRDNLVNVATFFRELRRRLLMKDPRDLEMNYKKLKEASQTLQQSCQSMYRAIGLQTDLRVAVVGSSTEPYFMYPGPGVFLFPFFARCLEVLIHNCMAIITLSRNICIISQNLVRVRVGANDAIAEILQRIEPLLNTTVRAYSLCATLLLVRPSTVKRAAFREKVRQGLEQLDQIDDLVGDSFSLFRSPSMQLPTRQLTVGDDVSVCLRRLVSRASIGSNASAVSDQSGVFSSFSFVAPDASVEYPSFIAGFTGSYCPRPAGGHTAGDLHVPRIADYRAAYAHPCSLFQLEPPPYARQEASSQAIASSISIGPADRDRVVGSRQQKTTVSPGGSCVPSHSFCCQPASVGGVHTNNVAAPIEDGTKLRPPGGSIGVTQSANAAACSDQEMARDVNTRSYQTLQTSSVTPCQKGSSQSRSRPFENGVVSVPVDGEMQNPFDGTAAVTGVNPFSCRDTGNASEFAGVPRRGSGTVQADADEVRSPSPIRAASASSRSDSLEAEPSSFRSPSSIDVDAVLNDIWSRSSSTDDFSEFVGQPGASPVPPLHSERERQGPGSKLRNETAVPNAVARDGEQNMDAAGGVAGWPWLGDSHQWNPSRPTKNHCNLKDPNVLLGATGQKTSGTVSQSVGLGAATEEMRQEMRLSKLIVSLYQICAMDTQELCSTVRGACIAVLTPSWPGARQNLRMMTLSLAMVFVQLYVGLRNLLRPDNWKWRGKDAFYRDVEVVHNIRLIGGLGILFGFCLFYGKHIDHFLGGLTVAHGPQTAKQWVILGFLCAHSFTYEGTTQKGFKRAVGTLMGGLVVEVVLVATTSYFAVLAFVFVSIAAAVFVFASPTDPASEYDREFGYIGQVFIWTVTFVLDVIWTYEGTLPQAKLRDTVVRSRIFGNLVGIFFSMVIGFVPPVFSAEVAARTYCATLLKTCRRCIVLINAAFLSLTRTSNSRESGSAGQVVVGCRSPYLQSTEASSFSTPTSPITAPSRTLQWARLLRFGCPGKRLSKHEWHRRRREKRKGPPEFHDYILQAEELLRHRTTRLLVVARMLYDEGASSPHSPFWRVEPDMGEVMNKIEYLIMSVVDTVDSLCHLAVTADPDLALFLYGGPIEGHASSLNVIQQDRRNLELLLRCRSGNALQLNLFRMVKAQSTCFALLAKEITAAVLKVVDRIIAWEPFRVRVAMPRKYLVAAQAYARARFRVERYNSRIYECLTLCGKELSEAGTFRMDEWKAAIFSVLLIVEKCDNRIYFMDDLHRFIAASATKTIYRKHDPENIRELVVATSCFESLSSLRSTSMLHHHTVIGSRRPSQGRVSRVDSHGQLEEVPLVADE